MRILSKSPLAVRYAKVFISAVALLLAAPVLAADQKNIGIDFAINPDEVPKAKKHYSPYVNTSFPNRVFGSIGVIRTSTLRIPGTLDW